MKHTERLVKLLETLECIDEARKNIVFASKQNDPQTFVGAVDALTALLNSEDISLLQHLTVEGIKTEMKGA